MTHGPCQSAAALMDSKKSFPINDLPANSKRCHGVSGDVGFVVNATRQSRREGLFRASMPATGGRRGGHRACTAAHALPHEAGADVSPD
jgi:hypothetical protein